MNLHECHARTIETSTMVQRMRCAFLSKRIGNAKLDFTRNLRKKLF